MYFAPKRILLAKLGGAAEGDGQQVVSQPDPLTSGVAKRQENYRLEPTNGVTRREQVVADLARVYDRLRCIREHSSVYPDGRSDG